MKDQFLELYHKHITRPGSEHLLEWIKSSDFFEAPASTRFHLACPAGLVMHSVNVYKRLRKLVEYEKGYSAPFSLHNAPDDAAVAICGLLHDICKANYYAVEMRNRKNERGQWERYPFYVVDDKFPYGHGEKSVYIVSKFMKLSHEEAMAIRWHMGGFDDSAKNGGSALGKVFEKYPLTLLLHLSDMQATFLDEVDRPHP